MNGITVECVLTDLHLPAFLEKLKLLLRFLMDQDGLRKELTQKATLH